jgi:DNA-binding MarR family transcriptional regulator
MQHKPSEFTTMAPKHPSILVLERFLPYRLSILSNRISGIIGKTYKNKFALSVNEWRIMAMLGEYPGASADEVSAKIQIEKSIVSRALKNLLLRSLVERVVDTQDRRRQNLSLSKTGLDIYNQIVPVSYDYEQQLLTCFTKEEQALFDTLSDKLYRHAEKMDVPS